MNMNVVLLCIKSISILAVIIFAGSNHSFARKAGSSISFYQQLTGDDGDNDKARWDKIFSKSKGYVFGKDPAPFLVESLSLLPVGKALDLGMGEGRNAVFLAKKGFVVDGVDISPVAVKKAKKLATENGVRIHTIIADLNRYQIEESKFEVVMVFFYLNRALISQIKKGVKHGGVVIFENNTIDHLKYDKAMNKDYLLNVGELKNMFKDFEILKYQEMDDGKQAVARIVAKRP